VSAATRELRDKYEEQAAAVTNMTEKTQLLTTMLESVSSAASEAGEALANVDAGIFVDEG
jgi:prefoldin subunit 5